MESDAEAADIQTGIVADEGHCAQRRHVVEERDGSRRVRAVTVAVKVTRSPTIEGFGEDVSVVVVGSSPTS